MMSNEFEQALDTPDGGYFRVIDYKTGHKEFDYTDLLCGQGLQMLLNTFAASAAPFASQAHWPRLGQGPSSVRR